MVNTKGVLSPKPQLEDIIKSHCEKLPKAEVVYGLQQQSSVSYNQECWLPQIQANHALKRRLLVSQSSNLR